MSNLEALNRIKRVQELESDRLDLSGLALTELPQELGNLTFLASLDLSDNALKEFPFELSKLEQLEELNLNNNQFSKSFDDLLVEVFESLTNTEAFLFFYISSFGDDLSQLSFFQKFESIRIIGLALKNNSAIKEKSTGRDDELNKTIDQTLLGKISTLEFFDFSLIKDNWKLLSEMTEISLKEIEDLLLYVPLQYHQLIFRKVKVFNEFLAKISLFIPRTN